MVGADTGQGHEVSRYFRHQLAELGVEPGDLLGERPVTARRRAEGEPHRLLRTDRAVAGSEADGSGANPAP